jgi:hypothetical protein
MTNHPSRRQIASIATNDPDNDPTTRVTLTRTKRDGRYLWLAPEGETIADGKTAADAETALRYVYNFPAWDLRFGS